MSKKSSESTENQNKELSKLNSELSQNLENYYAISQIIEEQLRLKISIYKQELDKALEKNISLYEEVKSLKGGN